ncbi:helix-turn-helix domain-containing protein [Microlunatus sp. GCM10028923]|uniref:TetR/AcrR family transcriptional regulator n=1 Tax=Microlunatus sp. GCM10028923 TaxID=3273400 RepID=UPI0036184A9A
MGRRERTRSALLEAAAELFLERGFDATTTRQIADRAGVSEMTLFRHFPTKEALLLEDSYDPMIAEAIRARPRSEAPMRAALAGLEENWRRIPAAEITALRDRLRILAEATTVRSLRHGTDQTRAAVAAALVDRGTTEAEAGIVAAAVIAGLTAALVDWAGTEPDPAKSADADLIDTVVGALRVLGGGRDA